MRLITLFYLFCSLLFFSEKTLHLWQFIIRMLLDKSQQSLISWTGDGWEFKLRKAGEVANLWGRYKKKPNMDYDKMSRGFRYYYDSGFMQKSNGKMHTYRFKDLTTELGHSPNSLFTYYQLTPRPANQQ